MKNFEQELQNELVCTYLKSVGEYDECHHAFEDSEIMAAYHAAIEALEKRTPKKVIDYSEWNRKCYGCPQCNDSVKYPHFYCQSCGQALDWD